MRTLFAAVALYFATQTFAVDDPVARVENRVSADEFAERIAVSAALLRGSEPLSPADAVMIVRTSNTLFVTQNWKSPEREQFERLTSDQGIVEKLTKALGESIPNKGMGLYFAKHDLHWGGSSGNIRDSDRYVITE